MRIPIDNLGFHYNIVYVLLRNQLQYREFISKIEMEVLKQISRHYLLGATVILVFDYNFHSRLRTYMERLKVLRPNTSITIAIGLHGWNWKIIYPLKTNCLFYVKNRVALLLKCLYVYNVKTDLYGLGVICFLFIFNVMRCHLLDYLVVV